MQLAQAHVKVVCLGCSPTQQRLPANPVQREWRHRMHKLPPVLPALQERLKDSRAVKHALIVYLATHLGDPGQPHAKNVTLAFFLAARHRTAHHALQESILRAKHPLPARIAFLAGHLLPLAQ